MDGDSPETYLVLLYSGAIYLVTVDTIVFLSMHTMKVKERA
ncbi:hypothetical protein LINGRAHAP2_LOCUS29150 [Linum grandiflorum]